MSLPGSPPTVAAFGPGVCTGGLLLKLQRAVQA